jgi:hypothetical protein
LSGSGSSSSSNDEDEAAAEAAVARLFDEFPLEGEMIAHRIGECLRTCMLYARA